MDKEEFVTLARNTMRWITRINSNPFFLARARQITELSAGTIEYQDIKKALLLILVTCRIDPIEAIDSIEKIVLDLNVLRVDKMRLRFRFKIDDFIQKYEFT